MERTDIELGEQIDVQRRPRSGTVISVRLSPEEVDRLSDVAEAEGKTTTQVATEALVAYARTVPRERIAATERS